MCCLDVLLELAVQRLMWRDVELDHPREAFRMGTADLIGEVLVREPVVCAGADNRRCCWTATWPWRGGCVVAGMSKA